MFEGCLTDVHLSFGVLGQYFLRYQYLQQPQGGMRPRACVSGVNDERGSEAEESFLDKSTMNY